MIGWNLPVWLISFYGMYVMRAHPGWIMMLFIAGMLLTKFPGKDQDH